MTEEPMVERLHIWSQNGEAWICDAYDHGPLCRRCRPATPLDLFDAATAALSQLREQRERADEAGWTPVAFRQTHERALAAERTVREQMEALERMRPIVQRVADGRCSLIAGGAYTTCIEMSPPPERVCPTCKARAALALDTEEDSR